MTCTWGGQYDLCPSRKQAFLLVYKGLIMWEIICLSSCSCSCSCSKNFISVYGKPTSALVEIVRAIKDG